MDARVDEGWGDEQVERGWKEEWLGVGEGWTLGGIDDTE